MKILEKLFGSAARVKVLRLFLFNEGEPFESSDVAKRARISGPAARKEITMLEKISLIKRKVFFKEVTVGSGKNKKIQKKKVRGYTLNPKFVYLPSLRNFLLTATPMRDNEIVKKLAAAGNCKLIIIAGAFIQDWNGQVDLLVVGDNINESRLENAVRDIEAEIGKELRFAFFQTQDFRYRMNIYDKLLRDVFDYPHQTILNRLGSQYDGDAFSA